MGDELALVDWHQGQVLEHGHFIAERQALLGDARLRATLGGEPAWGVATLTWEPGRLESGFLAIRMVTVVGRNGVLFQAPGHVRTVEELDLSGSGAAVLSVWLEVRAEEPLTPGTGATETGVPRQGVPGPGIPRVRWRAMLVARSARAEDGHQGSGETGGPPLLQQKLAELVRDERGHWHISTAYVPPLVRVAENPFLAIPLDRLEHDLGVWLARGSPGIAPEARRGVIVATRLLALLGDSRNGVGLHPHRLHLLLRELLLELTTGRHGASPPWEARQPYLHDDLARCLLPLLRMVQEHVRPAIPWSPPLPFVCAEDDCNRLVLADLPREVAHVQDVYLLLERPPTRPGSRPAEILLAGRSRLDAAVRWALEGVPLRPVPSPERPRSVGPGTDFFQIGTDHPEWRQALLEGALALSGLEAREGVRAFLYWLMPPGPA